MKKIKVVLNSIAILAAIGGAFAGRLCNICEEQTQYIPVNSSYERVGEFGIDYNCAFGTGVCTYYYADSLNNPGVLLPCREGRYEPVQK